MSFFGRRLGLDLPPLSRSIRMRARVFPRRSLAGLVGASSFVAGAALFQVVPADKTDETTKSTSLGSLLRTYMVYTMCDISLLVDNAPKLLGALLSETSQPFLRSITTYIVRHTFFAQFVGGETAAETVPVLEELRARNQGALFAYSVEIDESGGSETGMPSPHKRIVNEMIRCIDVAADFEDSRASAGRRTWVAIKMSALLPTGLLSLSKHITRTRPSSSIPFPGCPHPSDLDILYSSKVSSLTEEELVSLREMHTDMIKICTHAQLRGVKIILDAEYSWYQPALDALTLDLMRRFNKLPQKETSSWFSWGKKKELETTGPLQPLIYGTFQAYLQRTPGHLAQSLKDAKAGGYALGVKLVRGAYHPYEIAAHTAGRGAVNPQSLEDDPAVAGHDLSLSISTDEQPPVWLTKHDTDKCYNDCAELLVRTIAEDIHNPTPTIGVLFGTHNWISCTKILHNLIAQNLATVRPASTPTPIKDQSVAQIMAGVQHSLSVRNIPPTGISASMPDGSNWKQSGALTHAGEKTDDGVRLMPTDVLELGAEVTERVTVAQLYGMSDDLTEWLVKRTKSAEPFVIKYVPYGALSEVMPYLSRRAIENKSVLGDGGAKAERDRASAELWRRIVRA